MSEQSPTQDAHGVVERAHADIAAGREWKARDRLASHAAQQYDPQALELLGEVHYAMRDLPAAGAAWFGTARRGADVDEAITAWRERHGDHFTQMWRSLPPLVRAHEGNARVDALRRRAEQDQAKPSQRTGALPADLEPPGQAEAPSGGIDAAVIIAVALAVLFVVFAVVGLVVTLKWMLPGG